MLTTVDLMTDILIDADSRWETSHNNEDHINLTCDLLVECQGMDLIPPIQDPLMEQQYCPYMEPVQDQVTPMEQVSEYLVSTSEEIYPIFDKDWSSDHYSTQFDHQHIPLSPSIPQKDKLFQDVPLVQLTSPHPIHTTLTTPENGNMLIPHYSTDTSLVISPVDNISAYQEGYYLPSSPCSPDNGVSIQHYESSPLSLFTHQEEHLASETCVTSSITLLNRPSLHSSVVEPPPNSEQFVADPMALERAEHLLSTLLSHPILPIDTSHIPSPYDVDAEPQSVSPAFTQDYWGFGTPSTDIDEDDMPIKFQKSSPPQSRPPPRGLPKSSKCGTTKKISKRATAKVRMQKGRARDSKMQEVAKTKAITDDELLCLKPKKKRRAAKFDKAKPSGFCHICSRTPKNVRIVPCANITQGTCRKVTCVKCVDEFNLGHVETDVGDPGTSRPCTHCSKTCPERAQCRTYQRTNDKLRLRRLKQDKPKVIRKRRKSKKKAVKPKTPVFLLPSCRSAIL